MNQKTNDLYDRSSVGGRVRKLRLQHGLTQDEFAETIDVSSNFLCELENGRKGMSFHTLCRISKTYDVTTDYLLLGTTEAADVLEHLEQKLSALSDADLQTVADYIQLMLKVRQIRTSESTE